MAVKVPTNVERAYIIGRNGMYPITAISVWGYRNGHDVVFIDGYGKRDTPIRGGFTIDVAAMDELAKGWLEKRGYKVEVPDEQSPN